MHRMRGQLRGRARRLWRRVHDLLLPPSHQATAWRGGRRMMHRNRRFCVSAVPDPVELARMLTERTWTLCSGFFIAGHEDTLFLNDATCEDGAGEYGVIRGRIGSAQYVQVESVTFSWCTFE